jgi:hypothetical protein
MVTSVPAGKSHESCSDHSARCVHPDVLLAAHMKRHERHPVVPATLAAAHLHHLCEPEGHHLRHCQAGTLVKAHTEVDVHQLTAVPVVGQDECRRHNGTHRHRTATV